MWRDVVLPCDIDTSLVAEGDVVDVLGLLLVVVGREEVGPLLLQLQQQHDWAAALLEGNEVDNAKRKISSVLNRGKKIRKKFLN